MSNFVDRVRITCKAGNGGDGSVSFHREKFVLNGGPDGGDGGTGGDILVYADPNMHTLLDFRFKSKYHAENGTGGSGGRCSGKRGESLTIKLPAGTVIRDVETNLVVLDMDVPGETRTLLHGGRGGWGNMHFATPTRQAPNFAKPGTRTEPHTFVLELKTIADVGLVGFPNVGKSTFLSAVTAARPKIANYHFTTLSPNLGMLRRHGQDIVIADIPGLVEGASEGVGLGHDFLRHVDRTRLLLHVLDASGSEGRDPVEDFEAIRHELENWGDLAERPQILLCNKTDLPDAREQLPRIRAHVEPLGIPVFAISAAAHQGLEEVLDCVEKTLRTLPPITHYEPETEAEPLRDQSGFSVTMDGSTYVLEGFAVERLLDSVNFDDEESMAWFHRSLRRLGMIDALRKAGAHEGDTVRIEDMEFDFID